MNSNVDLKKHQRNSKIVYWVAQVIGILTILVLLIFIGGTLVSELIDPDIDTNIKEDYSVFLFFFIEVLIALSFIISWTKRKIGAILITAITIFILIIWGREDMNIVVLHLPLLLSGLLLLVHAFYKEWIVKMEKD